MIHISDDYGNYDFQNNLRIMLDINHPDGWDRWSSELQALCGGVDMPYLEQNTVLRFDSLMTEAIYILEETYRSR